MVSYATLEGRRHAIVPCTMIVEGVLPGSNGPLFYPADELARSVINWAGRPVLCYHAFLWSQPVSANLPEVYQNQKIGVIFNPRLRGNRLTADLWIDEQRCRTIDSRVWQTIESNRLMEISTGLFTDNDESPGYFKGVYFHAVARNLIPDHLAILPDQTGACSIRDGCGMMRANQKKITDWSKFKVRPQIEPEFVNG